MRYYVFQVPDASDEAVANVLTGRCDAPPDVLVSGDLVAVAVGDDDRFDQNLPGSDDGWVARYSTKTPDQLALADLIAEVA